MALVRGDALAPYGGGPRRQRARGCVTVREPAKGFFIAGSKIDTMNGIYCPTRCRTMQMGSRQIQLAYKHDQTGWLLALVSVDHRSRGRSSASRRYFGGDLPESSDDSDDDTFSSREWCLIDPTGRDRFAHKGDTIIPGAGHRWWHLHRGREEEQHWHDVQEEEDYETAAETEEELRFKRSRLDSRPSLADRKALAEPVPDDEDELPWQVIALLDHGVMQDLRAAFRHYQRQIAAALAGKNLPKPGPASLENNSVPGCWLFQVVAKAGIDVRSAPSSRSRRCGRCMYGHYLHGVERRGTWLRLLQRDSQNRGQHDSSESEEQHGTELWVSIEGPDGTPSLSLVAEEDAASLFVPLENRAEADVFDRPFEPRLEGAGADAEETKDDEDDSAHVDEQEEDAAREMLKLKRPRAFPKGAEVRLVGLTNPAYNGESATVVSALDGRGRHFVQLSSSGAKVSVKIVNLRLDASSEQSSLSDAAALLGVSLDELGLTGTETNGKSGSECKDKLEAVLRAIQRDTLDAPAAWAKSLEAHNTVLAAAKQKHVLDAEDFSSDMGAVGSDSQLPPHVLVESGKLGPRAAAAAVLASSETSLPEVEDGVASLRQILSDEQRRLARNAGIQWPPRAADLPFLPAEGADALRLRLTLVRALLRCRRADLALQEARAAVRLHPGSSAALLWLGRCLLRAAQRDEGLEAITSAADATPSEDGDSSWGCAGAISRLRALRRAERHKVRAEDAYGRGDFEAAVSCYTEAITCTPNDDKWGRATMLANRAACHRRARSLWKAIEDCDAALALFPQYARAIFRRGVVLLEASQANDSISAFEALLRVDRTWPNLCEWLVRAHAHAKREEKNAPYGGLRGSGGSGRYGDRSAGDKDLDADPAIHSSDLYTVLGVTSDATDKQLKRAYRLMSLKYHPDKQGGSARDFQRIATAYETLADPEKRRSYDEGADVKKGKDNSDSESEDERDERSLREEVERKYFPERYKFWPFGDPFIEKRKLQARRTRRTGQPRWHQQGDWEPM